MDVSVAWLLFFLSVMWLYSLMIDMLQPEHFKETMITFFGNFSESNYTHSLVDVAKKYSHSLSVGVATSVTTIISYVPVILSRYQKHIYFLFKFIFF